MWCITIFVFHNFQCLKVCIVKKSFSILVFRNVDSVTASDHEGHKTPLDASRKPSLNGFWMWQYGLSQAQLWLQSHRNTMSNRMPSEVLQYHYIKMLILLLNLLSINFYFYLYVFNIHQLKMKSWVWQGVLVFGPTEWKFHDEIRRVALVHYLFQVLCYL